MINNHFVQRNIILPVSDLITGNSVGRYLKFMQKTQDWSRDQIDEFQNCRLKNLIAHSYKNVPYYRDTMRSLGLEPRDIVTKDDLCKLPVLTKAIIKQEGIERFTAENINKRNLMRRSSSGSTGEPLVYFSTKEAYSINIAANLRGWYDMGYRLGDKFMKLSQNSRNSLVKRIQDVMTSNIYMSTNPMQDSNFDLILSEIEKRQPLVIRCYPDPLLLLAQYKLKHPEFRFTPNAITTTGNTLHPYMRETIEKAFGCKIFDSYSCEGNSCVFECHTHTCYHSSDEYGISEVLDDDGCRINKGIGRLISTDLWNFAHPFIRYDTQDLIEIDNNKCECGRAHMKVVRILGRDNDIIIVPSGRRFIVHNFTVFFSSDYAGVSECVEQFQVIKNDKQVLFKLVVNNLFTDKTKDNIIKYWEQEFGLPVIIELLDNIAIKENNKRKFIINE